MPFFLIHTLAPALNAPAGFAAPKWQGCHFASPARRADSSPAGGAGRSGTDAVFVSTSTMTCHNALAGFAAQSGREAIFAPVIASDS